MVGGGFSPPGVGTTGGCHPPLPPKEYVVLCSAKGEAKTRNVAQCVEFLAHIHEALGSPQKHRKARSGDRCTQEGEAQI